MVELSIVIPALNEAAKIAADVRAANQFLRCHNLTGEVIVVDDGSTDATAANAQDAGATIVVRLEKTRGKGAAVRAGVARSAGRFVLFADSGSCVPFDDCLRGLEMIRAGECDIAHGSRRHPDSVIVRPQPMRRRLLSRLFREAAGLLLPLPPRLRDTQCGFKVYRGEIARDLFGHCTTDGFLFDLELILLARKRGLRLAEFPIHWACDPDSRLHTGRSAPGLLRQLLALRHLHVS